MVAVEPDVTKREVQVGALFFMLRRRQNQLGLVFTIVVALFLFAVGSAYREELSFFLGLVLLALVPFLMWSAGKQAWKVTPMRQGGTVTLDDAGVRYENASINTHVTWEFYPDALETKSMFVLFTPQGFLPFPKRAFASTDEIDLARTIIKTNAQLSDRLFR